ncbi:hypothetical protein [Streptomyces sp. NPDC058694]|uniref:hypothetical protein n=1 Tax=Streptomyces sp. NPDC058694 TaxID=3346603 RepID=UPI0036512A6A
MLTATRVYELETMGLVSREQGRGTFVRDIAVPAGHGIDQQVVATDAVELNFNSPSLPGQADLLRQVLREVATSGDLDSLLRYHGASTDAPIRPGTRDEDRDQTREQGADSRHEADRSPSRFGAVRPRRGRTAQRVGAAQASSPSQCP